MFVFNKKLRPSAVEDSDSDDSFERLSDTEFDVISCSGDETAASESIEAVEKICEDLESQVDNLSLQLGEDDVASDVKKDEEIIKAQEVEIDELKAEIERMRESLREWDRYDVESCRELDEAENKIYLLNQNFEELEKEKKKLIDENLALKATISKNNEETEALGQQVLGLDKDLKAASAGLSRLLADSYKCSKENEQLQENTHQLNVQIMELQDKLDEARQQKEFALDSLKKLEEMCDVMFNQDVDLKEEHDEATTEEHGEAETEEHDEAETEELDEVTTEEHDGVTTEEHDEAETEELDEITTEEHDGVTTEKHDGATTEEHDEAKTEEDAEVEAWMAYVWRLDSRQFVCMVRMMRNLRNQVVEQGDTIDSLTKQKTELMEKLEKQEKASIYKLNELDIEYQYKIQQTSECLKLVENDCRRLAGQKMELEEYSAKQNIEIGSLKAKLEEAKEDESEDKERLMLLEERIWQLQVDYDNLKLENMKLAEEKNILEAKNKFVIEGLENERDYAKMTVTQMTRLSNQLQKDMDSLKKSKEDLEEEFRLLESQNKQLEARVVDQEEGTRGDMEEIRNLRKFKNELLEEIKTKEYLLGEELSRTKKAHEEQILAAKSATEEVKQALAEERKENEEKLRVLTEQKEHSVQKYKKCKEVARAYKKRCQELLGQQGQSEAGLRFETQINGHFILASSKKSDGFTLPEKFHNWNKGHLACRLKDNKFTTTVLVDSVPTDMEHMELDDVSCYILRNALVTVDPNFSPSGMLVRRYFENGLLKIRIQMGAEYGVYTFVKL